MAKQNEGKIEYTQNSSSKKKRAKLSVEQKQKLKEYRHQVKLQTKKQKLLKKHIKKKENEKKRIEQNRVADWFKLDNAATIYPSIKDENWSFVFRISAVLKKPVNPEVLQLAVDQTMPRFPTFNVGLKQGIFWNYFEEKSTFPKVSKEEKFPCTSFDLFSSKSHIVRIIYYNNRVSVECFHGVADGRSVLKFFNSLLRRYFILQGTEIVNETGCLNVLDKPRKAEAEDAFFANGTSGAKSKHKEVKAFKLTGTKEEFGVVNATMGTINVKELKDVAKSFNCSLTEFLVSNIAYSIYKKNKNHKRPIKISVPVDLRQFFETETLRNFSGYINIEIPQKEDGYTLVQIIDVVKNEFTRLNKQYVTSFINSNIAMQKNVFIKIVPLFLKNFIIKLCFKAWGEAYQTINMSNLGNVVVPNEFNDKIDKYCVNLGRPKYNAKTIGIVSFNNKMVITFSSKVKETALEEEFFSSLAKLGVNIEIESNRRDIYA